MINKEIFRWVDDELETTGIKVDGLIILNLDEELAIKPSEIRVNEYKTTIGEYFGVDVPGNLSKTKELNKTALLIKKASLSPPCQKIGHGGFSAHCGGWGGRL